MARNKHLINVHTSTGTTAPSGASLYLGEIAVQHTPNEPALWIKVGTSNDSEVYERFIGETEIVDLIANSEVLLGDGYTYSGLPYVTSATNIADAYSALTKEVLDNEYVIAKALNDLNSRVDEISGDTGGGGTDVGPLSAAVISLSAGVKVNEYVAAAAINYLNDRINEISGSSGGGGQDVSPLSAAVLSLSAAVITVSANTGGGGGGQDVSPLSAAVISLSGATTGISQGLNSLSSATSTLSGAAHTKITNVSGAVVSVSASVVTNGQNINTVSGIVETLSGDVVSLSGAVEDTITGVTLNGSSATVTDRVAALTSSIIYAGTQMPSQSLGNNGDVYLQADSVVLYETDGTTGLLGINDTASSLSSNWQLEDMDFTPYRYIKCYFKASSGVNNTAFTPAVIVTVQLDSASLGTTAYIGETMTPLPFNKNRQYLVGCAVDSTKTKFQVIHQDTLWDITASDANSNGRYLYKIEGYI